LTPCSRSTATDGARAGRDVRRRDVLRGVERQLRREAGVAGIEDAVVFVVGGLRLVAQPLHRVRRGRPRAVQVDARRVEQRLPPPEDPNALARCGHADRSGGDACGLRRENHFRRVLEPHLHDGPQFFGEQRRQRLGRDRVERNVQAAARRECHFGQRREQPAVADVVVGEQLAGRGQAAHQREE
jgi:hypothetical protein